MDVLRAPMLFVSQFPFRLWPAWFLIAGLSVFTCTGCSQNPVQIFTLAQDPIILSAVLVEWVQQPANISSAQGSAASGLELFEVARRTEHLLDSLYERTRWRIVDPTGFSIRHPTQKDVIQRTDIVLRVANNSASLGGPLNPEATGYLSVNLGRRQWQVDRNGRKEWLGTVSVSGVLRAPDGSVLMDARVELPRDPFAERPDFDNAPEINAAIDQLVDAFAERCMGCVVPTLRPPYALKRSPAMALLWHKGGTPLKPAILIQYAQKLDALSAEDFLWRAMQYVWPSLSVEDAAVFQSPFGRTTRVCFGPDAPQPNFCASAVLNSMGKEVPVQGLHHWVSLWAHSASLTVRGFRPESGVRGQPVVLNMPGGKTIKKPG